MRHFQNSVLDFYLPLTGSYASPGLEVAWASEAIFFIRLHAAAAAAFRFDAAAEISVDGVDWIPAESAFPTVTAAGQYALRLKHFGGWLRLRGEFQGAVEIASITTNLVLKE